MGQGENMRQQNSEALQENPREKMIITIQNKEDELSIRREASKIYETRLNEKEVLYRYEKKQRRED
jgi:hypothetical protein